MGYIAYLKNDWEKAERYWQGYRELSQILVKADVQNPKWLREAGYAEGNLCTLNLTGLGGAKAALAQCLKALEWMDAATKAGMSDKTAIQDLANRHAWLADAWFANNNIDKGLYHREQQQTLVFNLVQGNPNNYNLLDQWMRTQMIASEISAKHGYVSRAIYYHEQASDLIERLLVRDGSNVRWKKWKDRIARSNSSQEKSNEF